MQCNLESSEPADNIMEERMHGFSHFLDSLAMTRGITCNILGMLCLTSFSIFRIRVWSHGPQIRRGGVSVSNSTARG